MFGYFFFDFVIVPHRMCLSFEFLFRVVIYFCWSQAIHMYSVNTKTCIEFLVVSQFQKVLEYVKMSV